MKVFSKTLIAALLFSLVVVSPMFAQGDTVCFVGDLPGINLEKDGAGVTAWGPFYLSSLQLVNSTTIQAYFVEPLLI